MPTSAISPAAFPGFAATLATALLLVLPTAPVVRAAEPTAPPTAAPAAATKVTRLSTVPHPRLPDSEIVVLQLDLPPGASSAHHRHPGLVVGTIVAGEFEFQISGEPLRRLRVGDTFYEPPGALHLVSRNPSPDTPARVLVFMEHTAGSPLVLPTAADSAHPAPDAGHAPKP